MYAGIHLPNPIGSSISKHNLLPKTFGWGIVVYKVIYGAFTGYSIGNSILIWKTPLSHWEPAGPLKFPCHSYMLSGRGLAETPTRGSLASNSSFKSL